MAITIDVKHDLKGLVAGLDELSDRRVGAIIASTLTAVAKEAQGVFKADAPRIFDRPKPYTVNSIYISPANAQNLTAEVGYKSGGGNRIGPGIYLTPNVFGGKRGEKGFEKALEGMGVLPPGWSVLPGPDAQLDAYGNQSRAEIAKIITSLKGQSQGERVYHTKATKEGARPAKTTEYIAFGPNNKSGLSPGVYKTSGQGHGRKLKRVMRFINTTPTYKAVYDMGAIVRGVIAKGFAELFGFYAAASIERARKAAGRSNTPT